MKSLHLLIVVFGLASINCIVKPVYSQNEPGGSPLVQRGKKLFQTYCVSCHGELANGQGPVAAALLTKPADLTTILTRRGGDVSWGEIAKFIDGRSELPAHGRRTMPVWGKRFNLDVVDKTVKEEITRGDVDALIDYLKTIQVQ